MMNEPEDPALDRPTLANGMPVVSVEDRLVYEVERCQSKLDQALEDLRRWRTRHA